MRAIDVQGLTVRYGELTAVDAVDLHVDSGEIVALLGPNGAGKTTTIETIEGYRRPDAGTVEVLGGSSVQDPSVLGRVGVLLQHDGIYPAATPAAVLGLFHRLHDRRGPDPRALLDRVGLTARGSTAVRRLSGGEHRRLGLALALVGDPELLLLDEPTSGVDRDGRRELRAVVRAARDRGAGVLLTTHELDEAQQLADRVVILDGGRVVADGTLAELTRATASAGIRFSAEPGLDLTYLVIVLRAQIDEIAPGEYVARTAPTPDAVAQLTAWMAERRIMLGEVRAGRHRLEEVFDRLTGADPITGADGSSGSREGDR